VKKDFLSVLDLTADELDATLTLAAKLKKERLTGKTSVKPLAGKHVALLFDKPSLRTKSTFTIAVRELGGDVIDPAAEVALGSRETVTDVAKNLERWVSGAIVRTFAQAKLVDFANAAPTLKVVNALTDEEHPCQAVADVLTLQEHLGPDLDGRVITFVGDGNNVAASLAHAGVMQGLIVRVASPKGYELPEHVVADCARVARGKGAVEVSNNAKAAVAGADAIYTDVWASMGQERQTARREKIFKSFQVNDALMAAAGSAIFLHCLPAHRGHEVTDSVLDSSASVVFDQSENRLHAQKALLAKLFS
jgi:ornithine carbamoyltransferase